MLMLTQVNFFVLMQPLFFIDSSDYFVPPKRIIKPLKQMVLSPEKERAFYEQETKIQEPQKKPETALFTAKEEDVKRERDKVEHEKRKNIEQKKREPVEQEKRKQETLKETEKAKQEAESQAKKKLEEEKNSKEEKLKIRIKTFARCKLEVSKKIKKTFKMASDKFAEMLKVYSYLFANIALYIKTRLQQYLNQLRLEINGKILPFSLE